jgi:3-oxoacyl-[acyl-carrier-protein] synthase-3
MQAVVKAIEYHLPERALTNAQLAAESAKWSAEKIEAKTGICERRVAAGEECASDLAARAAEKLFASGACEPHDIDYLLLCTQSPDYLLPTTACLLQQRLGIATTAGALDFNLGCSGFVYGLGLAKGLIETGQARHVLLLTAETYSKFIHPADMNVRTLFGDAAAATLLQPAPSGTDPAQAGIGPFVYGTDGRGAANLIVKQGGLRGAGEAPPHRADAPQNGSGPHNLFMNGPEIFSFTLRAVPTAIEALLDRARLTPDDVELYIFHQANAYMLEHLRTKMKIPSEKFFVAMRHCGNTVSSTIPIALKHAQAEGRLHPGDRVVLVGFGVGYSWGATLLRWAV